MAEQMTRTEEVDNFWNSEKDDLWARKILERNKDLDKEI